MPPELVPPALVVVLPPLEEALPLAPPRWRTVEPPPARGLPAPTLVALAAGPGCKVQSVPLEQTFFIIHKFKKLYPKKQPTGWVN